ncbi:hypothetical protein Tco_0485247 [Tanacetum coccineum]
MTRCVMKKKGWKWKAENSNREGSKPGTFNVLWGDSQGPHEQTLEDNEGPINFGHKQPTTNQVLSPAHVNPNQVMSLTHVSLGHVFHSSTVHSLTVHEEDFNDEVTQIMVHRSTRNKMFPTRYLSLTRKGLREDQAREMCNENLERIWNDMKFVGYSDSSHNIDIDDGRIEFMGATTAGCQTIWLRELLAFVLWNEKGAL